MQLIYLDVTSPKSKRKSKHTPFLVQIQRYQVLSSVKNFGGAVKKSNSNECNKIIK